jgi:hypothetical protein
MTEASGFTIAMTILPPPAMKSRDQCINNTGIGTGFPNAKMHIEGGSLLAFGGYGYLKIGNNAAHNLAFDNIQLLAFNNGNPAPLYFRPMVVIHISD